MQKNNPVNYACWFRIRRQSVVITEIKITKILTPINLSVLTIV